jgi:transcriptional regulator with XRE-family HTH domain
MRRFRDQSRLAQADAAKYLGVNVSKISTFEDGKATLSAAELAKLAAFYSVDDEDLDAIMALGAGSRKRVRTPESAAYALPRSFRLLADLETDARQIIAYQATVIPGLLQSPSYIRSIVSECDGGWWESSEREVSGRVHLREERQRMFWQSDKPRRINAIIGESALESVVGDRAVMVEQLRHLLTLLENRPDAVSVRVLPSDTRKNPCRDGGLTILEFDRTLPKVAFASSPYGPSSFYEKDNDLIPIRRVLDQLGTYALDPERSKELIKSRLKEVMEQHGIPARVV